MRRVIFLILLAVSATIAAGQECPPAISERLTEAGLSSEEVQRVCLAASALTGHSIVIDAHGELLDDLVRVVLPFGTGVALNEAQYCGAEGVHVADLIAAATFDGVVRATPALHASDCEGDLSSIASRIKPPGPDGWAVVARMKLEWTPWRLTLSATDAEHAGELGEPWPELREALLDPANAKVTETVATVFPTPAGSLPALGSKAAFYFSDESFAIVIAPTSAIDVITTDTPLPPLRVIAGDRALLPNANALLVIGHEALNRFAAEFFAQTSIPIQTNHVPPGGQHKDVVGIADLTGLRVSGSKGAYTIVGDLKQEDGGYVATIGSHHDAEGDLAVDSVIISAVQADCNDAFDFWTCFAAFAPKVILAAYASGVALEVLGGKPWIPYLENRALELPWGADAIVFQGSIRRISSDDEALVVAGDFRLRKK